MTHDYSILWLFFAYILIGFAIVLWRVREEARETRARLDDMESRLRHSLESLEGEFAGLRIKHFGIFRVRRPPHRRGEGTDWDWTVGEIEEEPPQNDGAGPEATDPSG
jgi:hypothetical protein